MATNSPSLPGDPSHSQSSSSPDTYATFSRFTLELEFVTLLSSPPYLAHLATSPQKPLLSPPFIAYLRYLLYWTKPPYVQYLSHPGPTLKALELLQLESFRKDVLKPEILARWGEGLLEGSDK